jgi:hypothetical protein
MCVDSEVPTCSCLTHIRFLILSCRLFVPQACLIRELHTFMPQRAPGFRIRIDLVWIRIQHFFLLRIQFPVRGFDDQKLENILAGNFFILYMYIKN